MDRRTEASRARAVAALLIERHRLDEAIATAEDGLAACRFVGVREPALAGAELRLALLHAHLAELSPGRRADGA